MKKQNLILFGVLAAILGVGSLGTFKAGSGHVDVVDNNFKLVTTNKILKQENKKLVQENQQLKVMTDSLTSELEPKVEKHEPKKQKPIVKPVDTPDVFIREYKITVPIEEIPDN